MTVFFKKTAEQRGVFTMTSDEIQKIAPPALPLSFLSEFMADGRTPARAMTDEAMLKFLPALAGTGAILELGAGSDYYKKFMSSDQPYVTSNVVPGFDMVLDMTKIDLPDGSVDALVSVFALEHLFDFDAAFKEQYRVLTPGGRLLLVVPFMYYYHAAPDDFFRFSSSALDKLLSPFKVLSRQSIGGRWLIFAEFLHEKKAMGSKLGYFARVALRCLALPFLAKGLKESDPRYALAFVYLCEKERAG
ncbi:methyltransferase domain-containing protein [Rhizobium fabae]|uniref:SAM-dependent methyltransferase n=1 Tax=Rhizobium fabae TaxID=573179 RepID=A0A7W6BAQ1_9HYPH|nr:class I SAM-dependent methyltransferase [Rhizobium fabae]MBB3918897.1 SAM-dependent methyltransferase [Rhizobium fabae]RUM07692.1 class I SAM-dependent methyltransferase [Rhizobium fabae]